MHHESLTPRQILTYWVQLCGGEGDGGGGVGWGEAEYDEPGPDERQARAQQMQEAVQNMPIQI